MIKELLDLKPRNPYLALALDEAIVEAFEKESGFSGAIRLWSNPFSIVLGRTCIPGENLKPEFISNYQSSMKKNAWEKNTSLCRRASGGGTVIHGPGNINFSIYISLKKFPEMFDLKKSYVIILGMLERALKTQGVECTMQGLSDLVCVEDGIQKKISGNSQFRKKGIIVHHGTLITRKNLIDEVGRVLLHPPKEPDYRQGRSHASFLGTLPDTFDITSFYSVLTSEFKKIMNLDTIEKMDPQEKKEIFSRAKRLVREVYSQKDWILNGKIQYGNGHTDKQFMTKTRHTGT